MPKKKKNTPPTIIVTFFILGLKHLVIILPKEGTKDDQGSPHAAEL